jgi:hypothetical protein
MGKKLREKKCVCGVFVMTLDAMRPIGITSVWERIIIKYILKM